MSTSPKRSMSSILRNQEISPTTHHVVIRRPEDDRFSPGQFTWLRHETDKKPYSIASAPWEPELHYCIKRTGAASNALCDLKEGDEIEAFGPMGIFTLPDEEQKHYLLIAVGTGIAPMRSMIRQLYERTLNGSGEDTAARVTLLFGARHKDELLYREELEDLAEKTESFTYHATLTRDEMPGAGKGRVQQHLDEHLTEGSHIFICGLNTMVKDVKKELLSRGIHFKKIHAELYG